MTTLVAKEALRELRSMKRKVRHIIDTPVIGGEIRDELYAVEASLEYAAKLLNKQIKAEKK